MIAYEDHVLRSFEDRYECLRLCCLGRLVYKHLLEFHVLEPLIKGAYARSANDIRAPQDLVLGPPLEVLVKLVVLLAELSFLLLLLAQFSQSSILVVF